MFDADGMPTRDFVEDLAESGAFYAAGDIKATVNRGNQIGWLECDGTEVSRTSYPDLHAVLRDLGGANSYIFGSGDGSSTFGLPDYRGRALIGSSDGRPTSLPAGVSQRSLGTTLGEETHLLTEDEIPSHDHTNGDYNSILRPPEVGAITGADTSNSETEANVQTSDTLEVIGGDQPHNNMQPSAVVRWMIYVGRTVA